MQPGSVTAVSWPGSSTIPQHCTSSTFLSSSEFGKWRDCLEIFEALLMGNTLRHICGIHGVVLCRPGAGLNPDLSLPAEVIL